MGREVVRQGWPSPGKETTPFPGLQPQPTIRRPDDHVLLLGASIPASPSGGPRGPSPFPLPQSSLNAGQHLGPLR